MMECLRGCVGLLLKLQRSVPAINKFGNMDNCLLEDKNDLPAKTQGEPLPCGVGRPLLAASGHRLLLGLCLVGPDVRQIGAGQGWSVWSGLWAFFVGMTQCWIFCASVLRLLSVFALFRVWVPANQESPKLVEMVSIKPYSYFWCLKVMERCRSSRLYF